MTADEIEQSLRSQFEADLARRVERYGKSRVHGMIPDGFFSVASTECRRHYVDGDFYGCITLSQSVAEGLAKFIAERNGLVVVRDHHAQINILQRDRSAPSISNAVYAAFRQIIGQPHEDRNDFHHLNPSVEQDLIKLDARAMQCVEALYAIESEVFAVNFDDGRARPVFTQYWPTDGENLAVYVRFI